MPSRRKKKQRRAKSQRVPREAAQEFHGCIETYVPISERNHPVGRLSHAVAKIMECDKVLAGRPCPDTAEAAILSMRTWIEQMQTHLLRLGEMMKHPEDYHSAAD